MTFQTAVAPVLPPVALPQSPSTDPAAAILAVAEALQPDLAQGFQIDALRLRLEMERAFGGTDAEGAWDWKLAYEAGEVALVLFLRKFGRALLARAGSPAALLPILVKVSNLLPTHTRRSEEMERFQQFSTSLPMGLAALAAAQITPFDLVLEPSAGTGLLAILAEIAGGSLALNELAETRADLLWHLFPGRPVTRFDAAQIDDHLDVGLRPSVILMNPHSRSDRAAALDFASASSVAICAFNSASAASSVTVTGLAFKSAIWAFNASISACNRSASELSGVAGTICGFGREMLKPSAPRLPLWKSLTDAVSIAGAGAGASGAAKTSQAPTPTPATAVTAESA
jgi:hypothetical protein